MLVMDGFSRRLIGTIRRESLDHVLFCNTLDLTRKLEAFRTPITTRLACPARWTLPRLPNGLAQRDRPLLRLLVMAGASTVVAYFRSQWPLDREFATHTHPNPGVERRQERYEDADGRPHDDITAFHRPVPDSAGKIELPPTVHDEARMRRQHVEVVAAWRIVVIVVVARIAELLAVEFVLAEFMSPARATLVGVDGTRISRHARQGKPRLRGQPDQPTHEWMTGFDRTT